jgi:hypothetical protein
MTFVAFLVGVLVVALSVAAFVWLSSTEGQALIGRMGFPSPARRARPQAYLR